MLVTTTTSEHIGHWIRMRRPLARFSGLESSFRARYSADFIIITSGFRFSIHTGHTPDGCMSRIWRSATSSSSPGLRGKLRLLQATCCLLYTSDAADEEDSVDL